MAQMVSLDSLGMMSLQYTEAPEELVLAGSW